MAADYWVASTEVHDTVRELVANHHPDLVLDVDEIAVVFREKAGKSGGQIVYGTPRKVTPLMAAIAGDDYKWILEVAADKWEQELTAKQREALLDHLLCACRTEEDGESGNIKRTIAKPDIMAFRENVERYGMWFPKEEDDDGDDTIADDVDATDMFDGE